MGSINKKVKKKNLLQLLVDNLIFLRNILNIIIKWKNWSDESDSFNQSI